MQVSELQREHDSLQCSLLRRQGQALTGWHDCWNLSLLFIVHYIITPTVLLVCPQMAAGIVLSQNM